VQEQLNQQLLINAVLVLQQRGPLDQLLLSLPPEQGYSHLKGFRWAAIWPQLIPST
jgi:hypothetical protein